MTTRHLLVMAAAAAALASGCATVEVGTERSLGDVSYVEAFNTARTIMGQYFTVASADADSGVIQSVPKPLAAGGVLGGGQTRQLARVRICRAEGGVVAYAAVSVQRQSAAAMQQMARGGRGL